MSTFFEGSMYLFIFFWSSALNSARASSGIKSSPPYGLIFSCFMCSMGLGSMLFTMTTPVDMRTASQILTVASTLASCCLLATILFKAESLVFWAFCILEGCVGLYFPSMAYLKGKAIEDGSRGKIYSVLRLPLNAFVVVAHSLAEDGT